MPRPRRLDGLPAHIDPAKVPAGLYWDLSGRGHWYIVERPSGRAQRRRVAGPDARLSELHEIAEARRGIARGTVGHVLTEFERSTTYAGLAERTRADYAKLRAIASALPTKIGALGTLEVDRIPRAMMQRIIDRIGASTPTKANHVLRYLRRTFRWGMNRGLCSHNPCAGLEAARERRQQRLPDNATVARMIAFAREGAARKAHTPGSCAPYLWIIMELAHQCRLRPVEAMSITEDQALPEGLRTRRRKRSRDTLFLWTPRLREVWDAALALRAATWARTRRPVDSRPENRPLIVAEDGGPLGRSSLDSAWQRLVKSAIAAGVLSPAERFGLHDLKRRAITSTKGRSAKLEAGGHRTAQMLDVYDHEVPEALPLGVPGVGE